MTIDIHTSSNFLKDDGTKESYHLPESATPMQIVDALLKSPESVVKQIKSGQVKKTLFILLGIFFLCHAIYGLIVGSFSGNVQWFAAPIKIVGGAALSALLCYPSLYIFGCLSGANITPSQTLSVLFGGLTLTSILLVGFAPVAFIFTFSIKTVAFMGFIHISIWAISIFFGLRYIVMGLTQMDSRKDSYIIKVWCTILILTMLQMTTTLRPIIGVSDTLLTPEKSFFVEHWLDVLNNKRNRRKNGGL
ncbi:MAG: hypothetical protein DRQ49_03315 [Gammaproteobacteria bacterium]|nr:MAG: hypothetical protein DRQ49_03315 [Gammaproteobacteria bacterium]RKZ43046.1 MAG: hypothetical protein DRQ41_06265 [Gammaproteobacteria bacterium]RKZ76724.1 MAG: hypothetical protein DRQ57_02675 [Gammaproteobacteria bacterium]